MSTVLIALPAHDFDPTEAAIPWSLLRESGHRCIFATPDGRMAQADPRMLDGRGLGPWSGLLRADARARAACARMQDSMEFRAPIAWSGAADCQFHALLLPGGHAAGMRPYLESSELQQLIVQSVESGKIIAAICHGVVLAARSTFPDGRSVLFGRRCTALPRSMELSAWALTVLWLGRYYRTYTLTVQAEVTAALAKTTDFDAGPLALLRDDPARLHRGFVVRDGWLLTARWPGDAHRFGQQLIEMLAAC